MLLLLLLRLGLMLPMMLLLLMLLLLTFFCSATTTGWALGALVAALEFGEAADAHRATYTRIYRAHCAKLASLQGADGSWTPSLLNVSGYPLGETTATAGFVYGIGWGVNAGLLPSASYGRVVEKGWAWLATMAQLRNGTVGYCQPGGGSPENNYGASTTSFFCVGDFLLAASEVAVMKQRQEAAELMQ